MNSIICERMGISPVYPDPQSLIGVASSTIGRNPLYAVRHLPTSTTSGWYCWWGEAQSDDPDWFSSYHIEHLPSAADLLLPYLALPPGWGVIRTETYEDVWFDPTLLVV
jgi:hypothetical protein